jgi:hypothetical protein
VHHRQRLADVDLVAQLHQAGQADGEVDRILRTHAAAAQADDGQAEAAAVGRRLRVAAFSAGTGTTIGAFSR